MSQYRCPLFGQGDESDLESPAGGIALSHKELIPTSSDALGGYYPLALARDQMAAYPANFVTPPSAAKWFWRVKTFECHMLWSVDPYLLEQTFPCYGYKGFSATEFSDEADLHDPLSGLNAHYRQWRGGVVNFGPDLAHTLSVTLAIGSHLATTGVDPTPTLNELFLERTDGKFTPRILIDGFVQVDNENAWHATSVYEPVESDGSVPSTFAIDGEVLPNTYYIHPFGPDPQEMLIEFTPIEFWSWNGFWHTTTGAALSNPRV